MAMIGATLVSLDLGTRRYFRSDEIPIRHFLSCTNQFIIIWLMFPSESETPAHGCRSLFLYHFALLTILQHQEELGRIQRLARVSEPDSYGKAL